MPKSDCLFVRQRFYLQKVKMEKKQMRRDIPGVFSSTFDLFSPLKPEPFLAVKFTHFYIFTRFIKYSEIVSNCMSERSFFLCSLSRGSRHLPLPSSSFPAWQFFPFSPGERVYATKYSPLSAAEIK
jgi:hypothetical protein